MNRVLFGHPLIMTDNLEAVFESSKQRIASKGRRAATLHQEKDKNKQQTSTASAESNTSILSAGNVTETQSMDEPPRIPSKRRHTWEDRAQKEDVDSRLIAHDESDDDNLPIIPELEDYRDEPREYEIAAPPTTLTTDLLSYRELDSDLLKQSAFQILDDEIDMKILTKAIIPEKETSETDETWEMEQLFAEIKSFMTTYDEKTSDTSLEKVVSDREVLI